MAKKASEEKRRLWSVESLSIETGLDRRTITRLLADVSPQEGKKYRLRDLVAALTARQVDTTKKDRARLVRSQANIAAMEEDQMAGTLVDKEDFLRGLEPLFHEAKRIVMGFAMTNEEKDRLLNALANIPNSISATLPDTDAKAAA